VWSIARTPQLRQTGCMRIYLPATAADLRAAELSPRYAHAVTDALRAEYPDADIDVLEFHAQSNAALGSLHLLRHDLDAPPVRVVVAADVPDALLGKVVDPPVVSAVALSEPVTWRDVVCVFADEAAARPLIEQARAEATKVIDADLLWYDRSEVEVLADSLLSDR
jgi:hypothetical protein